MLVCYIKLWTNLETLRKLLAKMNETLHASSKKLLCVVLHSMVGIALMASVGAYNMIVVNLNVTNMRSDSIWINALLWVIRQIPSKLVEGLLVYVNVSFFYAAILMFATTQVALKVLAEQGCATVSQRPRNEISSLVGILTDYKQLLAFHKMAADIFVLIPEILVPLLIVTVVLPVMDGAVVPEDRFVLGDSLYYVVDFLVLLVIWLTIPILVTRATDQYGLYREKALNFAATDAEGEKYDVSIVKVAFMVDMSSNQVQPMRLFGFVNYDCSFAAKLLAAVIAVTVVGSFFFFRGVILHIAIALHLPLFP
ncbi:hypothetical protein HDE_07963 [Halotydeus destructor]|nr:hypothetical protein HDE_07963 [Halotydeus destructor]